MTPPPPTLQEILDPHLLCMLKGVPTARQSTAAIQYKSQVLPFALSMAHGLPKSTVNNRCRQIKDQQRLPSRVAVRLNLGHWDPCSQPWVRLRSPGPVSMTVKNEVLSGSKTIAKEHLQAKVLPMWSKRPRGRS